jgi:hypothetical protein
MIFKACKAAAFVLIATSSLIWTMQELQSRQDPPVKDAPAQDVPKGSLYQLTLIPDYENKVLDFEGSALPNRANSTPDTNGLPLNGSPLLWPNKDRTTWYFRGTFRGAEVTPEKDGYRVRIGPITLPAYRTLDLNFPDVVLDPSRILVKLHSSDQDGGEKADSPFHYEAGPAGLKIDWIEIPFHPIQKDIHLTLNPLMGEALAGNTNGLRLSGKIQFSALTLFNSFRSYCPDSVGDLPQTDYRRALLLDVLDSYPFSGRSVISPSYSYQPTGVDLHTELVSCQYNTGKGAASVEAVFFGKAISSDRSQVPDALQEFLHDNGNHTYPTGATQHDRQGYQIWLGQIVLGPADTLTITVPHTQVLVDSITPPPDDLIVSALSQAEQPISIVYHGPRSFPLVLPYRPEPQLYLDQFPALLRPGLLWVQSQFGSLYSVPRSLSTWILLGIGLFFLLFSRWRLNPRWAAPLGWVLIAVSFYYGIRGSFGWVCAAVVFFFSQISSSSGTPENRAALLRRSAAALAGLGFVVLGVYLDIRGASLFRNVSEHELSPLTSLVLVLLVGAVLLPLYGWTGWKSLTPFDLPPLILCLAALSLYDAFDKSLLSLVIFLAAGWYILHEISADNGDNPLRKKIRFRADLQKRWNRVFRNWIVVLALLVLVLFAVSNDLPRIFANPVQVSLPAPVAFLAIPVLVFVSVFLTFAGIALLFILVYPYLPFRQGYLKAAVFALVLFLVFLFGVGTDDRLIEFLPNLLIGRVIYYLSMTLLIGITLDIYEFMERENKQLAAQGSKKQKMRFQEAAGQYLKKFQGAVGTLAVIASLALPTVYSYFSNQPVIITYFGLLQKLIQISS